MSYKHTVRYARKYMYNKFEFEVPEIVELFKDDAAEWAQRENEDRKKAIAQLQSQFDEDGNKKSRRQMKEDAKELKDDWEAYYKPVTAADYGKEGYGHQHMNIYINEATGKFDFEFCQEMTYMDKLKKGLEMKKRKEAEANENRNVPKP